MNQEQLKRVTIRKRVTGKDEYAVSLVDDGAAKLGIDPSKIIGWFRTKNNMACGYSIFEAEEFEKKEFGNDCFRIFNNSHDIAGIITVNLEKGTFKFLDNEAYLEDEINYLSAMAYTELFIDNNLKSFEAFGIV